VALTLPAGLEHWNCIQRDERTDCAAVLFCKFNSPPGHCLLASGLHKLCRRIVIPGWGRISKLRRKPWPRRSTRCTGITSVAGAILVNAPTLGGWYLLQGQAVAKSRTTGIYALLFSSVSRRKGERGEIGVTRIECSRTQQQKHCEECGDGGKCQGGSF
jgi:hypothetical protein